MIRKIFIMAYILLLAPMLLFALQPLESKLDKQAVNFTLRDIKNQQISLSDFKNQPVILFFWTTWCPFCRGELRVLNNNYHNLMREGVVLLTIDAGEPLQRVEKFIRKESLFFRVLLDEDRAIASSYSVLGVPTYFLINKKNQIVFEGNSFPREYKKLISE